MPQIDDTYNVLKNLEARPDVPQRTLAENLGYSLGKVNYLLKSLADKGLVKTEKFMKSNNKWGFRYILTPKGMAEKVRVTKQFLLQKEAEYDRLQGDIERLRLEIEDL